MAARRSNLPLVLGIAALLVGATLVFVVLRNSSDGNDNNSAASGKVPVLVATKAIPPGTVGRDLATSDSVTVQQVDAATRSADALSSADQLTGRVVGTPVAAGQQVKASDLRAETLRQGSIKIPADKQAVAIQIPFVAGGAGYVGVGDKVNVYGVIKNAPGGPSVRLVLTSAEILDVSNEVAPRVAGDQSGERPTGTQLTYLLALSPADAGRAIFLTSYEGLYLTLVPENQEPAGAPPINYGEIQK